MSVWTVATIDESKVNNIKNQLDLPYFLVKVLVSKGFDTCEKIQQYLDCSVKQLSDPFLLKDMEI